MDHRQAIDILLAYAERPRAVTPQLDVAIVHLSQCPACAAGIGQLLAACNLTAEDRLTCGEAEELLPGYLVAGAVGAGGDPAMAELRIHLVGCPACRLALAELAELRAFAEGAAGVEPPVYPVVRRGGAPIPAWTIDALGRLLVDLARALVPVGPAPALAGLKGSAEGVERAEATFADALPDLELQIAVEGQPGSARRTLLVTVNIPSRGGWPNLGGSEVALLDGDEELATVTTDAFGTAAFVGLGADEVRRVRLAVRPGPPPGA